MSIEKLKEDINNINGFTSDFFNKLNVLNNRVSESITKLDNIISIEKENDKFLSSLESGLSDTELNNISDNLKKHQQAITEKQKDYLTVIEKNSGNIAKIKKILSEKKDKIKQIQTAMENLETSISLVKV